MSPIVRRNTKTAPQNIAPCGGVAKGHIHHLTQPGMRLMVQWSVAQPAPNTNCTLKIGTGGCGERER